MAEGDDLTLICKLTPPDAELDDAIIITFMQEGSNFVTPVVIGRTYAKRNVTTADSGEYRCQAGNLGDNVTVVIINPGDSGNIAALSQQEVATLAPIIGISLAVFIVFMTVTIYVLSKKRAGLQSTVYPKSAGMYNYCCYIHHY